jgi:hypothetical protein
VREYDFTGGEPFMNDDILPMLEATLAQGPASVLTNGVLLRGKLTQRLRELSDASPYSLDLRISLDGWDAASIDPIRGVGTFDRILRAIHESARAGLNPVITVTEACDAAASNDGRARFLAFLRSIGLERPRLEMVTSQGSSVAPSSSMRLPLDWAILSTARSCRSSSNIVHVTRATPRACRAGRSRGVWRGRLRGAPARRAARRDLLQLPRAGARPRDREGSPRRRGLRARRETMYQPGVVVKIHDNVSLITEYAELESVQFGTVEARSQPQFPPAREILTRAARFRGQTRSHQARCLELMHAGRCLWACWSWASSLRRQ